MVKKWLFVVFVAIGSELFCSIPDLLQFKDLTASESEGGLFIEEFENPAPGWKFGANCRIEKTAGLTGSTALLCERSDKDDYDGAVARIRLNLRPERIYKVTAKFRSEGVSSKLLYSPCIEYCKDGKYVKMANPTSQPAASGEWQTVETLFVASDENYLVLRMFYAITGKTWWDDIRIEEVGANPGTIYPVKPVELLLNDDGDVECMAFSREKPKEDSKNHLVIIELDKIQKTAIPDISGRVKVSFGKLPDGSYKCRMFLVNLTDKTIIAKNEYTFLRAPDLKKQAYLDEHGRLIVDGSPFMPIGIYCTWIRTADDLKRISAGGFNFILTYTPQLLNIQPEMNAIAENMHVPKAPEKPQEWKANIRRSLDMLAQHKLKLLNFPCDETFRHPVLLGAYIADERPVTMLPMLKEVREKYRTVYPGYPVVALTDKAEDYIPYSQVLDVLGIDPYPIGNRENQSMLLVRECLIAARRTGKPLMFVPQAFNWGAYRDEPYSNFRSPTDTELRSMVLLAAVYGVKWYCYYSYTGIFERMEKKAPGSAEKFWQDVSASAKLLRELEPWLLSLEKAPEITIDNKGASIVDAGAFAKHGKIKVIITACGPENAEAVIAVPGKTNLRSRFGNTENLGNGKYLFRGNNITSDILMEP